MEKYPLIEEAYRAYHQTLHPKNSVGICNSFEHCALAQYLAFTYKAPFQVTGTHLLRVASYKNVETGEAFPLPEWALEEARAFDLLAEDNRIVTKEEYDIAMKGTPYV